MTKKQEDIAVAGAEAVVGACLRYDVDDMPPDHAAWLKAFLRSHLTGREWRLVADAYGWRKEPKPGATPDNGNDAESADEQADMIALMGFKVAEDTFAQRFPIRPGTGNARKPS